MFKNAAGCTDEEAVKGLSDDASAKVIVGKIVLSLMHAGAPRGGNAALN